MIKLLVIAVIIYLMVISRSKIRLPHAGMQAAVDVLKAVDLSDRQVVEMARAYIRYADREHAVVPPHDPYTERLVRLTDRYVAVNGVKLNFKAYRSPVVNAFATADGSIRVYTGLMDILTDDELLSIIGHEMGHVRNNDTLSAMRKAYLSSAARGALGVAGGALGQLSASQLGGIAQQYASAQFSQQQEHLADDFSFGFLVRNRIDPYAIAHALEKLHHLAQSRGQTSPTVMQLFSTHPQTASRAARMRAKADAHMRAIA